MLTSFATLLILDCLYGSAFAAPLHAGALGGALGVLTAGCFMDRVLPLEQPHSVLLSGQRLPWHRWDNIVPPAAIDAVKREGLHRGDDPPDRRR